MFLVITVANLIFWEPLSLWSLCQLFLISNNDPGLCQMFLVITVAYLIFWGPLFMIILVTLSAITDQ
jgi:hypothetical protein